MVMPDPTAAEVASPLIENPAGILAVLLVVLGSIFWVGERAVGRRLFGIVPALVFCYFVPTILTTLDVIPSESPLYGWIKTYLLPCSLLLLILALDVPAILRLGPKAIVMLLVGTIGIVIGGPIALLVCKQILPDAAALPEDAWRGMSALSGSWIGGGANFVAIGQVADVTDEMLGLMVIVDVFIANIWMGVLLYLSGHQHRIDAWTGADRTAIDELVRRTREFQARVTRVPSLTDIMVILAIGFAGMWVSFIAGEELANRFRDSEGQPLVSATTAKFIIVTALGVALSFTPVRRLEGAGASRLGAVMIYLLVATIGASANFRQIDMGVLGLLVMGAIWMLIHITVMLGVGRLIRAPIFYVAVGSQANIGGAASAPVVAAAYHPALAPVGALLAVAGYVLGTYAGLACMKLLQIASG